nr:odorant-binding protein 1 [Lytta caraganae]
MLKFPVIFIIFNSIIIAIQCLDCGIRINNNEQLIEVLNKCLKSNKTMADLYDMTSTSSESDASNSSEETGIDDKMSVPMRNRRFLTLQSQRLSYQDDNNETIIESGVEQNTSRSAESVNETCVVHCIFQNMGMTDTNGFPDHTKILESLIKPSTGREFKDFIQDTADECFRDIQLETTLDSCGFSMRLISCLADKGKANCADWPVGDLPFKTT